MKVLLFLGLFSSSHVLAECFPKNHLFIELMKKNQGISEKVFLNILDEVEKYYAPIVQGRGAKLKINRLWKDGTVNSDASQVNGEWIINSYGGLARYKGMTKDAYMQVACHEMGHHLGGAPKYFGDEWASNEGQADYFATLKCMKAMGIKEHEMKESSLVLAKVLAELGSEPVPSLDKRDSHVVKKTNDEHPAAQCRLDTYVAGSVCDKEGELSETDPSVNTCYPEGDGARPYCWFKP